MKFQICKDTIVETVPDDIKVTDLINAKVNSIGREVKRLLFCSHLKDFVS